MIAFDLDGTLAEYHGWQGIDHIGKPVPAMVKILDQHLRAGDECCIFTSRVSGDAEESNMARHHIAKWLRKYYLPPLDITCIKSKKIRVFYDDRAISVIANTGKTI